MKKNSRNNRTTDCVEQKRFVRAGPRFKPRAGTRGLLLNLRLLGEIEQTTYRSKSQELRDRVAKLTVQLEAIDRSRDEKADAAIRVFELSQALPTKWLTADYAEKRTIMDFLFLNLRLEGKKLIPELHEPFNQLFDGLTISSSRGDKIRTCDL